MIISSSHRCGTRIKFARVTRAVIAAASLLAVSVRAPADTLTWGTSGTGGTGNWDLSNSPGWWNGTSNVAWVNANNDVASFGGTAGTVTLTTSNTANGLSFATTGYLVTGGTLAFAGPTPTITVNSSVTATVASILAGGTSVTKAGAGTLTLGAVQSLTGTVTVAEGTLSLTGGNFLQDAAEIVVASNATLASVGDVRVTAGQTLGGNGLVDVNNGAVIFEPGSVLSPGSSVGEFVAAGDGVFHGGMTYVFEINDATGTPGVNPGWDLYHVTGDLTLAAIEGGPPISIDLKSLSGTSPGLAANFSVNVPYQWLIAEAGREITTFDPSWFQVVTADFRNLPGSAYFSVVRGDSLGFTNDQIYVTYSAVPEPGTCAMALVGLSWGGYSMWPRRRRARGAPASNVIPARGEQVAIPLFHLPANRRPGGRGIGLFV